MAYKKLGSCCDGVKLPGACPCPESLRVYVGSPRTPEAGECGECGRARRAGVMEMVDGRQGQIGGE